jgi:Undecaprenyl-phosphate galactose phosphotransferase WbaP
MDTISTIPVLRTQPIREISASSASELATGALILFGDLVALIAAFAFTIFVRQYFAGASLWEGYLRLLPLLILFPFLFGLMNLYPGVLQNPVEELRRVTIAITFGMLLLVVATFLAKEANIYSRAVLLIAWPTSVVAAIGTRTMIRSVCARRSWWGIPSTIVGAYDDVEAFVEKVRDEPSVGIRVVDVQYMDMPWQLLDPSGAGAVKKPSYAILVVPREADVHWLVKAERAVWGYQRFLVIPRPNDLLSSWMTVRECRGLVAFEMRRELLRRSSQIAKRSLDLALTVIGGVLILPLIAAIAAAIRLSSRGPVFYGQQRIGRGHNRFMAWKFRTMVDNADRLLGEHLEKNPQLREEWANTHKLKQDPRVTKIGRILRRTSLDELPQIWNVLTGEMSLVGPRPVVSAEVDKYGESFEFYRAVRPGITGLWQVSGRSDTSYGERVSLDVRYVRHWSVWLDIYLLVRTFSVVLRGSGAY